MKPNQIHAPRWILAAALVAGWPLGLSGCGQDDRQPPKDVSTLKTPSDILKEAKAKESASKP